MFRSQVLVGQCVNITVPNDVTICEPQNVPLTGVINGDYIAFEWSGTNGFFEDQNLTPVDFVTQTTTYTLSASQFGDVNLVTNGDFESGNTGFTSEYDFNPNTNVNGLGQGDYNLDVVYPAAWSGASCPSMNGSTMMVINAAVVPNVEIYCTDVAVTPNTDYVFTTDIMTLNNPPPILQFSINGVLLGNVFNGDAQCVVAQFYEIWNSGANTTATICILNQSTAAGGNDFAMDNVTFTEVCYEEEEFTVTLEEFDVQVPDPLDISCDDLSVELTAIATPDNGQLDYVWTTFDGNIIGDNEIPTIEVDEAGTYNILVTDQNGCTKEVNVEVEGDAVVPVFDFRGVSLLGCETSSIIVETDLFDPNLEYTWVFPNGEEYYTEFVEISEPGTYTLTVLNPNNNCMHADVLIIEEVVWDPTIDADVEDVLSCLNDTIDVVFQIDETFDTFTVTSPDGSETTTTNLSFNATLPGQYQFSFTLGNCSIIDTFEIAETESFEIVLADNLDTLTCLQLSTSISATVVGNYESISWSDENGLISSDSFAIVTESGMYFVEAIDSVGCIELDSILVNKDIEIPTADFIVDTITCLDPSGGFEIISTTTDSLLWIGNNSTSSSLNPTFNQGGEYILVLFAQNGCNDTTEVFLPASENFPELVSDITNINCTNTEGIINIASNIPADFEWDGPSTFESNEDSISVATDGFYYLTVTTDEGCILMDTFEISIDTIEPNLAVDFDSLTCNQSFIVPDLISDIENSINWVFPDNSTTVERAPTLILPGMYTITAQGANGCEKTINMDLLSFTEPSGFNIDYGFISCADTVTHIVVDNLDLSYSLSDGNGSIAFTDSIAILNEGTFLITGTNQFGCDSIPTVIIEAFNDAPDFNVDYGFFTCSDTSTYVVIDDASLTYLLSNGGSEISFTDSILLTEIGEYTIEATNVYGCIADITFEIEEVVEYPQITLDAETLNCNNETSPILNLSASLSDVEFLWSGTNFSSTATMVDVDEEGWYYLEVVNELGCSSIDSIFISSDFNLPNVSIIGDDLLECHEENETLSVESDVSNYELIWTDFNGFISSANQVTVSEKGSYYVSLESLENGCIAFDTISIEAIEGPDVAFDLTLPTCPDEFGILNEVVITGGNGPYNVFLDNLDLGVNSDLEDLEIQDYTLHQLAVFDDNGCSSDTFFIINEIPELQLDLTLQEAAGGTLIFANTSFDIDDIEEIRWSPSSTLSCDDCISPIANPSDTTQYSLTIVTKDGCVIERSILVTVQPQIGITIPNVFSPNGDGSNDYFTVYDQFESIKSVDQLAVYDRWGNNVFLGKGIDPNIPKLGWNGTFNGQDAISGVYAYFVKVTYKNDEVEVVTGDVTIVR